MTLVLALQYQGGIVLASDSQATSSTAGQPTKQDVDKLFVLGNAIGWGASGSTWLTGRVREQLDGQHGFGKDIDKDAVRVFEIVNKQQHDAQRAFVKHEGDPSQRQEAFCGLFCGHTKNGKPKVFEVDVQGARGFHTAPYAAIGSGGIFAVHAIVSVSHFNVAALTWEQASALAYRTIANAIKTAAYGLGGKVQICSVTPEKAWCLTDGELKAVADVVDIWNAKEVETLGTLGKAQPTPEPPPTDEPPTEAE